MRQHPRLDRRVLLWESLVILAVIAYYELGTFWFYPGAAEARANAVALWHLEQQTGLFVEPAFQSFFDQVPALLWLLIFFYVGPHFGLTLGFVAWSYWYRFHSYPHVRNAIVAFTMLSFGFQWIVPLSPPRLVPEAGLADSLQETLPVSGNTPWIMRITNPYAALPSVHFGWSLLVALLAIRLTKSPHRWWWLSYPLAIGLSILATGNHWLLDLVLAVVFLGITEAALVIVGRRWDPESGIPPKASRDAEAWPGRP